MDIEGAEVEVLAAGRDAVRAHRIQFALDTNHIVKGPSTDKPVEKIFKECGYKVETAKAMHLVTTFAAPEWTPSAAE